MAAVEYSLWAGDILEKMQVSQPNNVKIYNLSAGKSLPEVWVKHFSYILFNYKKYAHTNCCMSYARGWKRVK